MKRCPKCNRTYASGTQKFCTQDGGLLEVIEGGQGDTIRIDSAQFKDAVEEAPTRAISRELVSESGEFDPFKTVMARPEETTGGRGRNTQDLVPPSGSLPPPQTSAPLPPAPTSASLPPPPAGTDSFGIPDSGTLPTLPPLPGGQPQRADAASAAADLERTLYTGGAPPPPSQPLTPPPQSQPLPSPPQSQPLPPLAQGQPAPRAAKKSKLPLVLGLLAVLLVLGMGALAVGYFVVLPMLAKRTEVTRDEPTPQPSIEATPRSEPSAPVNENPPEPPPYSPPPNAVQFVNSNAKLDGKLAENFVDFSFYYPKGWQKDPTAGIAGAKNFAKIQRQQEENFPQEIFAVGWYASTGSDAADKASYPRLAEQRSAQFEKEYPEYRKISEGETKAGVYNGYEFRFESVSRGTDKGDIKVWGRVIFVPPTDGTKNGVTLLMLATSLAPEPKKVDDVGVKGELPMLLESFRFGKK
ncbi:MAG: hypothetical protein AABM67_13955 [Acidobacteriota bacterium]